MTIRSLTVLLLSIGLAMGCGDDSGTPMDAGSDDAGARDAGSRDAGVADARASGDATPGGDAGIGPPGTGDCNSDAEMAILDLVNMLRAEAGAGSLGCDADMARAAQLHTQDMCDQDFFAHDSLDGRTPTDRLTAEGVVYSEADEILAAGQPTPDAVLEAWSLSMGSRVILEDVAYGRMGLGFVPCPRWPLWTIVLAD